MEFLQANGITFPCHISYNFKILKSKTAKIDYKRSINDYFKKMLGDYEFKEQLEPIIQILSDSIYQQHLKNTLWPVSRSQKTKIELNISDTHKFDSLTLFWSCIGWIVIKDETSCTQIEGNPDVKILSLDDHKLKELETKSIEEFSQKASWDNL
ncbi:4433_t:CDS:1 [Gigaspora margarita]|uniref:4433_t:CDS:1 n=1 Tax=Gigaspora margarita TaxID=4874 RepID=A0ABN7WFC7_GIGMA|nr:4433_t:CDS:1 [Gigaspora margarita]